MNNSISLNVSFEGQKPKKIQVSINCTVDQFLDFIKKDLQNDDIKCIYFKGRQLNPNELLLNNIEDYLTDVYLATESLEQKEEDFKQIYDEYKSDYYSKHDSKFKIFTTASEISFLHGDKINLELSYNYNEVLQEIKKLIDSFSINTIPKNYEAHIYLPGGIPFNDNNMTLSTFFSTKDIENYRLYVVITRELGDFIDEEVTEPCNSSHFNKNILSPLFETTETGLTQIASLLGYFYHGGIYSESLLNVFAKITRFTPLITNLFRVIKNEKLNVLNIVSITGPLHMLFKSLAPKLEYENIFEYTFRIVSFVSLVIEVETLDLRIYDCDKEDQEGDDKKLVEYLKKADQQDHVVIWESDINSYHFEGYNIDTAHEIFNNTDDDDEVIRIVSKFIPVPPQSLKFVRYPTFVQCAKENEFLLFINHSDEGLVNIIDPKVGTVEQISIEKLVTKTGNHDEEDHFSLINKNLVDQLTIICVDESLTQNQLVKEFLSKFVDKSTKLNDSSVYGLVTFGNKVQNDHEYFLISSQFIEKINRIEPVEKTLLLYDALNEALQLILKDLDDEDDYYEVENHEYTNAEFRVIVISNDGIDGNSTASPVTIANNFIDKNVLIDTILVSDNENTILPTLSKLTGGLCINIKDGLKFIDQEGFINVKKRFRDLPFNGEVSEETFEKNKSFSYDKEVKSREMAIANSLFSLATPKLTNDFHKNRIKSLKIQRALDELKFIQMNPSNNFVIYSNIVAPDEWRIFIKGPAGSPFENKWLNCFMRLTNLYPIVPPSFWFLSIPFHPNVSCEGKISFGLVENNYKRELKIGFIIDGIVKLLGNPEEDFVVNREAYEMLKSDKNAFLDKQRKSETGKNDYNEYLGGMKVLK